MSRTKTNVTSVRVTGGLPDGAVRNGFVSRPITAKPDLNRFRKIFEKVQLVDMAGRPWFIRDARVIEEAFYYTSRNLNGRGNLNKITFDSFAQTFRLNKTGSDLKDDELLKNRPDVQEMFKQPISQADYWRPEDAVQEEFGALSTFVAGLVTPLYPRRISVKIAAVCLDALRGPNMVNWAGIFFRAFQRQVSLIRHESKSASHLTPWLYNLWDSDGSLTKIEQEFYENAQISRFIGQPNSHITAPENKESSDMQINGNTIHPHSVEEKATLREKWVRLERMDTEPSTLPLPVSRLFKRTGTRHGSSPTTTATKKRATPLSSGLLRLMRLRGEWQERAKRSRNASTIELPKTKKVQIVAGTSRDETLIEAGRTSQVAQKVLSEVKEPAAAGPEHESTRGPEEKMAKEETPISSERADNGGELASGNKKSETQKETNETAQGAQELEQEPFSGAPRLLVGKARLDDAKALTDGAFQDLATLTNSIADEFFKLASERKSHDEQKAKLMRAVKSAEEKAQRSETELTFTRTQISSLESTIKKDDLTIVDLQGENQKLEKQVQHMKTLLPQTQQVQEWKEMSKKVPILEDEVKRGQTKVCALQKAETAMQSRIQNLEKVCGELKNQAYRATVEKISRSLSADDYRKLVACLAKFPNNWEISCDEKLTLDAYRVAYPLGPKAAGQKIHLPELGKIMANYKLRVRATEQHVKELLFELRNQVQALEPCYTAGQMISELALENKGRSSVYDPSTSTETSRSPRIRAASRVKDPSGTKRAVVKLEKC